MKILAKRFGKDSTKKKKINWKKYFDNLISNEEIIESYKKNGFLDKLLVKNIRQRIIRIIEKSSFKNIYDCGCGDGSVTGKLVSKERNIIGIDFSSKMCEKAAEKGIKTIQIDIKKLTEIPLNNLISANSFSVSKNDCIVFCESLGCLDNPESIIEGVLKINKNLSFVLLSFPNSHSLIRKIVNYFYNNDITYFSLESIKEILNPLSFKISNLTYIIGIPFIYHLPLIINRKNKFFSNLIELFVRLVGLNVIVLFKKN